MSNDLEEQIIRFIRQKGNGVSFFEFQQEFGKGEYCIFLEKPNLVIWPWLTEAFCEAVTTLKNEKILTYRATTPMTYVLEAAPIPELPVAEKSPKRHNYTTPHWIPTLVDLKTES